MHPGVGANPIGLQTGSHTLLHKRLFHRNVHGEPDLRSWKWDSIRIFCSHCTFLVCNCIPAASFHLQAPTLMAGVIPFYWFLPHFFSAVSHPAQTAAEPQKEHKKHECARLRCSSLKMLCSSNLKDTVMYYFIAHYTRYLQVFLSRACVSFSANT